jgi:hypothetical protein
MYTIMLFLFLHVYYHDINLPEYTILIFSFKYIYLYKSV